MTVVTVTYCFTSIQQQLVAAAIQSHSLHYALVCVTVGDEQQRPVGEVGALHVALDGRVAGQVKGATLHEARALLEQRGQGGGQRRAGQGRAERDRA